MAALRLICVSIFWKWVAGQQLGQILKETIVADCVQVRTLMYDYRRLYEVQRILVQLIGVPKVKPTHDTH